MSTVTSELRRGGNAFYAGRTLIAVAVIVAIASVLVLRQPRVGLILASPPVIQAHLYCAVTAAAIGAILLAWRKGRAFHRAFGWLWVYAVTGAILTSYFIRDAAGNFTWIHTTSVVWGTTLALAVAFAVRRNIKWHRRLMLLTYWVGIVGAIGLAFIPHRLLWRVFFG